MQDDLFGGVNTTAHPRGKIDNSVGQGNGKFLGHVANGMARDELVRRWKAGEFPDLNATMAHQAMRETGR